MAITAVCACGKKFSATDEYEGLRAICPACKREFIFQRGGIPVFEQVTELPPLPSIQTNDDDDQYQQETPEVSEAPQRFWKDPIIVFGWGTPILALLAFCGYLAWPQSTPLGAVAQSRRTWRRGGVRLSIMLSRPER
jgi:hypothetical protein